MVKNDSKLSASESSLAAIICSPNASTASDVENAITSLVEHGRAYLVADHLRHLDAKLTNTTKAGQIIADHAGKMAARRSLH